MIPHEREMVGRLEGKPFQLVGLSIDDEVKTLKDFLAKEKLPWAALLCRARQGESSDFVQRLGHPRDPRHLRARQRGHAPLPQHPSRR